MASPPDGVADGTSGGAGDEDAQEAGDPEDQTGASDPDTGPGAVPPAFVPPAIALVLPFFALRVWMGAGAGAHPVRLRTAAAWPALLRAGRVDDVVADALHRLRVARLEPLVGDARSVARGVDGPRLLAAAAFPLSPGDAERLVRRVAVPSARLDPSPREALVTTTSNRNRQLFDVPLEVVGGSRFQPTGFPDLGAATFERPRRGPDGRTLRDATTGEPLWENALLVEPAQSMANQAEAVGWDPASDQPADVLAGLPWVRVIAPSGAYLTSSRTEAHRLASAFVKQSTLDGEDMTAVIRDRLGLVNDRPVSPAMVAGAVMALDPLCLVHGVVFADNQWPGQPRIARVLTGFVEAAGVKAADSGGVKKDSVRHQLGEVVGGTAEGYGTVPYHGREWTAAEITASFSIDRAQVRSYGLGDEATALLEAIARWQVRCLADEPMRLRTACDLVAIDPDVVDHTGEPLPPRDELEAAIRRGVEAGAGLLGEGKALDVTWSEGKERKGRK